MANKTTILFIIALGGLWYTNNLSAQNFQKEFITREIFLNCNDSILKFNIQVKPSKKKIKNDLLYYWYGNDILHVNRGGYSSNPLHGKYVSLDKKMRLRVEGYFKDGLKTGTWKSWRESGELLGIVKWKRGERQGRALFYDNAGNIQKSVKYKNDLMDGNTFVYHRGGAKEKIRYRKGIELKKEKSSGRIKNPENNISTGETNPTKKDNFFRKLSKKITKPFKKKGNKSNKDLKESPGGTDSKKKVDSKIDSK